MAQDRIGGDEVEVELRLRPVADIGARGHIEDHAVRQVEADDAVRVGVERSRIDGVEPCERRRDLPEGVDFWDFDCRFGPSEEEAQTAHLAEITKLIDAVVQSGGTQFYVEILAKHGVRKVRDPSEAPTAGDFLEE